MFFGGDSSQYLRLAYEGDPVGFAYERPSGYPLVIDALTAVWRELAVVTTVQHLAGLATGVLLYALLVRLDVPRVVATVAAAVVLLDGYAIALEQHILTESLFTLALFAAMYLTIVGNGRPLPLAGAGALLAAATLMRTAGLFAVPAWLAYVAWTTRRPVPVLAATAALALPLVGYAAWHDAETGDFGLTRASGWFLYARIGEIGECRGADVPEEGRRLCRRLPRDSEEGPAYHLFHEDGILHRTYGSLTGTPERQARINGTLRDFAVAIIRDRPLEYAGMVGRDSLRYLTPGVESRYISDQAISFRDESDLTPLLERVREPHLPGLDNRVHPPAAVLRAYADVVHTPRWLVGPLLLAVLAVLVAPLVTRVARPRHRAEAVLLAGVAVTLVVGVTATSEFVVRYLLPAMPLLVAAGTLAVVEIHRAATRPE